MIYKSLYSVKKAGNVIFWKTFLLMFGILILWTLKLDFVLGYQIQAEEAVTIKEDSAPDCLFSDSENEN